MNWTNENISKDVASELEDLKKVLDIVAQLSYTSARRIINYCDHYIEDKKMSVPGYAGLTKEAVADRILKSISKDKE